MDIRHEIVRRRHGGWRSVTGRWVGDVTKKDATQSDEDFPAFRFILSCCTPRDSRRSLALPFVLCCATKWHSVLLRYNPSSLERESQVKKLINPLKKTVERGVPVQYLATPTKGAGGNKRRRVDGKGAATCLCNDVRPDPREPESIRDQSVGEEKWEEIRKTANVQQCTFTRQQVYEDALIPRLTASACEVRLLFL
ncbi:hypothetical protein CEXT_202591 [Caerostris extrusa]|uniref:Heme NO-binding domain-containing protein n=1 Tax=Caerostris extrusa TaxID=172846 RepID=A0AAV4MG63_CAEEX|nr:hypothetical protein CEXT_202591 [Caerostris extrusa]